MLLVKHLLNVSGEPRAGLPEPDRAAQHGWRRRGAKRSSFLRRALRRGVQPAGVWAALELEPSGHTHYRHCDTQVHDVFSEFRSVCWAAFAATPGLGWDTPAEGGPGESAHTVLAFADVPSEVKDRGGFDSDAGQRKVCRFRLEWLGNCSGLHDETYGYREGKPCIFIKLNRVLGFKPKASDVSPRGAPGAGGVGGRHGPHVARHRCEQRVWGF